MQSKIELASKRMPAGAAGNKEAPLFPKAHFSLFVRGRTTQLRTVQHFYVRAEIASGAGQQPPRELGRSRAVAGFRLATLALLPTKFLCREEKNLGVPRINRSAERDLETATGLLLHKYHRPGT